MTSDVVPTNVNHLLYGAVPKMTATVAATGTAVWVESLRDWSIVAFDSPFAVSRS